ncbi:hypothetical protein TKK_0009822 [Trichogramma kaykai]
MAREAARGGGACRAGADEGEGLPAVEYGASPLRFGLEEGGLILCLPPRLLLATWRVCDAEVRCNFISFGMAPCLTMSRRIIQYTGYFGHKHCHVYARTP